MGIQLTDEQNALISKAVKWYNSSSSDQVFQYSAPAGAGKSTVMHAIISAIGLDSITEVAPMAYTGAAAIIMRINGFFGACTIHSWLYVPMEETVVDVSTGKKKKRIKFVFKGVPKSQYKLICIDEGSMVPKHMLPDILKSGIKVLVCGDLNQLPPVKDNPAFLYDGEIFRLSKIMRQSEGSAIVEMSQRILKGEPLYPGNFGDVVILCKSDFEKYIKEFISSTHIVICGTNNTRDFLNEFIRREITKKKGPLPKYGEKIICRKNNWDIEVNGINLANGLSGTVRNNPSIENYKDGFFNMDFTPDLFPDITFSELKCDFKFFKADNKTRQAMKDFYSGQYRGEGEKFEFGYAITTHLSQGSQYIDGVYLQEYMGGGKEFLKHLNYTGITRFRNKCYYIIPDTPVFIPIKKSVVIINGESI